MAEPHASMAARNGQGPLVSIVIATYNTAAYLPFAIRSALEQTYRNVEVLVVDDGSTDHTAQVIQPFLVDQRFRYLTQENAGQASAKNSGVRASRGDYIAFLDADDIWALDKIEAQLPLFRSEAVGVAYSRLAYINASGKELRVADNELFRGHVSGPLLIRNFIGFGSCIVRRTCFERLGSFDERIRMGIDYDLWLRFSTQYQFDYVDRPLLYYRVWSGQMSGNCHGRYLSGIAIMRSFLANFPGVVDRATVRHAWAHTYVGFGQCALRTDRGLRSGLSLYMRALRHQPAYFPAWKAIAKALLRLR